MVGLTAVGPPGVAYPEAQTSAYNVAIGGVVARQYTYDVGNDPVDLTDPKGTGLSVLASKGQPVAIDPDGTVRHPVSGEEIGNATDE